MLYITYGKEVDCGKYWPEGAYINRGVKVDIFRNEPTYHALYIMCMAVKLSHSAAQGKSQVMPFAFIIKHLGGRHPTSQLNLRMHSRFWRQFQMLHLWSVMEQPMEKKNSWKGLAIWAVKEFKHLREQQQSSSKSSVVLWLRKGKPMEGTWQPLKQRGSHLLKGNWMEKWLKTWLMACSELHKSLRWRAARWTSQSSWSSVRTASRALIYHLSYLPCYHFAVKCFAAMLILLMMSILTLTQLSFHPSLLMMSILTHHQLLCTVLLLYNDAE